MCIRDSRNGAVMVQNTKASVRTYGLRMMADFRCRVVEMLLDGMQLDLDGREVWVKFLGRFNAYNLTAVYATALLLGADRDEVLRTLSGLGPVSYTHLVLPVRSALRNLLAAMIGR